MMRKYESKRRVGIGEVSFTGLLACILTLIPIGGYAFEYNSYEHYSFASCSLDKEGHPTFIHCDVPTGNDGRRPDNMSAVVFYSNEFEGDVLICVRHLTVGLTGCSDKFVRAGEYIIFDSSELTFNWSAAEAWGGETQWWNWVVFIQLWGAEMSPERALQGYKVYFQ